MEYFNTSKRKKSVICCNIEREENKKEKQLINGLVKGHAYILSTLASFSYKNRKIRLVKCINPWGNEIEWNGDWSKTSSLWQLLKPIHKKELLNEVKNKGQFWMSYSSWLKNFDICQIVNLTPQSLLDNNFKVINFKNIFIS